MYLTIWWVSDDDVEAVGDAEHPLAVEEISSDILFKHVPVGELHRAVAVNCASIDKRILIPLAYATDCLANSLLVSVALGEEQLVIGF